MNSFQFIIDKRKSKSIFKIILAGFLINAACFVLKLVSTQAFLIFPVIGIVIVVSGIALFFSRNRRFRKSHLPLFIFICFAIIWMSSMEVLLTCLNVLFAAVLFIVNRDISFYADDDKIEIRSFPLRRYRWNQVTNMLVRDGMITIDFKNNRIIQRTIDLPPDDEKAFNSFCSKHLHKS